MKTAVIAIGGNAILLAGERGTKEEQINNLKITCKHLAELVREGYDLVLTHGNGPQVGNIMLQNEVGEDSSPLAHNGSVTNGAEESRELSLFAGFKFLDFRAEKEVFGQPPRMSLDVCGAESQGEIGYLLQQVLVNELEVLGIKKTVVSVITQVLVDKEDEAFHNPTKPIGPYYGEKEATRIMVERGWKMVQDKARGGWRRVVPSPIPKEIVERDAIRRLIFSGENSSIVVIAGGGGGIPVIKFKVQSSKCKKEDGSRQGGISAPLRYEGVEAVIDKDLAASVLARSIKEKLFIMLTDVKKVALDFGTEKQRDLGEMSLKEAKRYLADGQFPSGSMGPKIEAAILFLEGGGEEVIITSPDNLLRAIKGKEGTHIRI